MSLEKDNMPQDGRRVRVYLFEMYLRIVVNVFKPVPDQVLETVHWHGVLAPRLGPVWRKRSEWTHRVPVYRTACLDGLARTNQRYICMNECLPAAVEHCPIESVFS